MAGDAGAWDGRAWGRCIACGAEGHIDARTGLCPSCQQRMPSAGPPPGAPAQAGAPPAQPYPSGTYPYGQYPPPYAHPQPYAYPQPYVYPAPYANPYADPYPYQFQYQYPYASYYAYPTKPREVQTAESAATVGVVLCLIGLLIVFPFGFVSAPLGAIGIVTALSAHRRGVPWATWAAVFGAVVLMLGILGTILLFTMPPIW